MPIPLLLDPLLLSSAPDQLFAIWEDLEPQLLSVTDIEQNYPVHVAGYLSRDHVESILFDWRLYRLYQGNNGRKLVNLIEQLELKQEPISTPARIQPNIDLGETWRAVLSETSNNTTSSLWRNPIILASNMAGSLLPDEYELCYTCQGGTRRRNLVKIGLHVEHPYFERDLDPWRLRTVGPPAGADACHADKQNTWQRLPRPKKLSLNLSLRELVAELQKRIEYSDDDKYIDYVPKKEWNPLGIEKDPWRNAARIFPTKRVQYGPRSGETGYEDRAGRIWLWHEGEYHWDVQLKDGADYRKVSYTGENRQRHR